MKSKATVKKINALVQELEAYTNYKKIIKKEVDQIKALYVKGKVSADKRDKLIFQHLRGKSLGQINKQYDAYLDHLKGQIKVLTSEVFYDIYYDKSTPPVKLGKSFPKLENVAKEHKKKSKKIVKSKGASVEEAKAITEAREKAAKAKPTRAEKKEASKTLKKQRRLDPKNAVVIEHEKIEEPEFIKDESVTAEKVDFKPSVDKITDLTPEDTKEYVKGEKGGSFLAKSKAQERLKLPKGKKQKVKEDGGLELPEFIEKKLEERTFLGDKTEIPPDLVELETLRKKAAEAQIEMKMSPEQLREEAERVRKLVEEKKPEHVYKPSKLGAVANLFVRGIGRKVVGKYPELFEQLYSVLRPANIRTLSNTYVNIIIFLSIVATILSGVTFFFLFLFTTYSFGELFLKTFLMAIFMGIVTMIVVYAYPFMKVSERKKNIEVNMPFAVNHMSAIAASGLSPAKLFELVAQSEEYGEVTIEFRKIVEYINLFGYDLTTALNDVAQNTPSDKFKDLLEGINATMQSGGNIQDYLEAKTNETIDDYRISQQKHIETISTYSDIYTGILIAAPLFFISILSLVSILGGTIAGFPVQTIIAAGTYLAIPILNVGFLLFLQIGQQEV